MRKTQNIAIILAAGKSLRMQGIDKIETPINGEPLITHTLKPFLKSRLINKIIIAANDENFSALQKIFSHSNFKNILIIMGGKTRFQSAKNAFDYSEKKFKLSPNSTVLFHNCGNVLVTTKEITDTIRQAKKYGTCIVARPASDTLKKISNNTIMATLDRKEILYAETPQTFRYDVMRKAYGLTQEATDESSLVEATGQQIAWIPASTFNRKITTQYDLEMIKMILEKNGTRDNTRHGVAADSHIFAVTTPRKQRALKLCGISVKNSLPIEADSDGDVAIHALTAAISQAIGGGSLGTFATAMCKQGITDSKKYLQKILTTLKQKNFIITHAGLHFECAEPHIGRLSKKFKISLSALLQIPPEEIGITASTGKLKSKGIHCIASVTLSQRSRSLFPSRSHIINTHSHTIQQSR